jgi:TPP-dependent pyruvate/acetoin dehydrogenase alpha subunit
MIVDGNDVLAVYEAASEAVARARSGEGPVLLECKTYRLKGHAEHDSQTYVQKDELAEWKKRDPIARLERHFDETSVVSAAEREAIRHEVSESLDADVAWAEHQPFPVADYSFSGVYADEESLIARRQGLFLGGSPE